MRKTISIIGSGFSSLSAACYLAKAGHQVTVYEKNSQIGGRASQYQKDGFTFDMGPTWYWMPDVFERFFSDFGKKPSDYYELIKMDPAYQVYFGPNDSVSIASSLERIYAAFEEVEKGSSDKLKNFLRVAKQNYEIAISELVYKPGVSPLELITLETATKLGQLFVSIQKEIKKQFTNSKLVKILEFPVLFLGAKPSNTPALYSFMNWADFGLGTWHPKGGMYEVVRGIEKLARELGVHFVTSAPVDEIVVNSKRAINGIKIGGTNIASDFVLSGADYHHTETLLPNKYRQYSEKYWSSKTFAPSSILYYVGFNKKIENVSHHTLFFDKDFEPHAASIYDDHTWPEDPLFYASFPSITDASFAPDGKEAATFLIPISVGLEDTQELRDKYFKMIMERLEKITNQKLQDDILFVKSFCIRDFVDDYNSYGGNAYGLANTLTQTAFLRPKIKSKKVNNLFFTGQLTVPGPGVPPALISGKIASTSILKQLKHETPF